MTAATETETAAKPVSPNPSGWRPSSPSKSDAAAVATVTGNRALKLEEPLLFEIGSRDQTGVDFEKTAGGLSRLGGLERNGVDLPGLSEPETVRHYTRLSRQNYAIDLGLFPLGTVVALLVPWHVPQPSCFWRRELFDRFGAFRADMHYAFDAEFMLRLAFEDDLPELLP